MDTLSIRDIAKMAGVSVSTVSRVLNGYSDVSARTKARVQQIIQQCGYQPNNAARNLKRSRSNAVGLLMEGSATPFVTGLSDLLEEEINAHGYALVPHRVTHGVSGVDTAVQLVKEKRLQGLIICGGCFIHTLAELQRLTVPTVFCTTTLSGIDPAAYSSVRVDDFRAAKQAVGYLCAIGHRQIAILGGIRDDRGGVSSLRFQGYRAALSEHAIPFDARLARFCGLFTMQRGYDAVCELLSAGLRPTAIFCVADELAVGACKAIFQAGLRVPQDISVMGYDGTEIARFYEPSLCTVRQPSTHIAHKTAEILVSLMEGEGSNRHVVFPTEIVIGGSCMPPPTSGGVSESNS